MRAQDGRRFARLLLPLGAAIRPTRRRRHESWGPRPRAAGPLAGAGTDGEEAREAMASGRATSTKGRPRCRDCDKSLGGAGQPTDHDGGLGRGRGRASRHSRRWATRQAVEDEKKKRKTKSN